jgi:hypothetical protein
MDVDSIRKTRLCADCDQELSHAAYYRHLEDRSGAVCPGKRIIASDESSVSESELLDEFDTSDFHDEDMADNIMITTDSEQSSSCTDSDVDGEEIWESSEDEDDQLQNTHHSIAQRVLNGMGLFLTKFQLFFKVSERGMSALLLFLVTLFAFLASIIGHPLLSEICRILPKTMWGVKNIVGVQRIEGVIDYVVCPKCHSLFSVSDCSTLQNGKRLFHDERCDHIEYPNHPHNPRRSKCNTSLMKRVKVKGTTKFTPRKLYHYHSIVDSLKKLISRHDFLNDCEQWRKRNVGEGIYADVYDGAVWRDLQNINGLPFLSAPHNLCFMINVDWFNPYTNTQYSVGAIYLTILNLPRSVRFKFENVLLVGLMPGPKEPPLSINSYLYPLVEDLKLLFQGVTFRSDPILGPTTVRGLLCCVGSDLPATKKLCGFLSHSAKLGCSKCLKSFASQSPQESLDYSGFNIESWKFRTLEDHKKNVTTVQCATTATSRAAMERQHGVRFSALLCVPMFDVIRYHTVDPMHNVFLGIAKLCVKIWKDKQILKASHFNMIQERVDQMIPPANIGRIPRKICSGFAAFTADEWKHWILIYSMFALHGILPERDYNCWFIFVQFCLLTCKSTVTRQEILSAHNLIVEFCTAFQDLYGTEACTPNLHMACHLKESMLDYGPFPAFWCFSFERYNGILEGMCKSWISPEKQMFSKFLNLQYLNSIDIEHANLPKDDFVGIISGGSFFKQSKIHSSVEQMAIDGIDIAWQINNHTCEVARIDASLKCHHNLSLPQVEKVFSDTDMHFLKEMYSHLYVSSETTCTEIIRVSRFYLESKQVSLHGLQLLSTKARSQRSAAVVAHWRNRSGIDPSGQSPLQVGIITSIFCHDVHVRVGCITTCRRNLLARVNWLEEHPRQNEYIPTILVTCTLVDTENCSSFIPVSRIAARCAITTEINVKFDYGEDNVHLCVPLVNGVLI